MPDFSTLPTWVYWIAIALLLLIAGLLLEPVGLFAAIVLFLVGIIPVVLEDACQKAREKIIIALPAVIRWAPVQGVLASSVDVPSIIARLILLALAVLAGNGEITNLEALLPYVVGTSGSSVINIDAASVAIFTAVPAFLFALLLELWFLAHRSLHIFETDKLEQRKWFLYSLRGLLLILVILSVIASILLWWYRAEYLAMYKVHPEIIADPTQPIPGLLFGLLISLSDIQVWLFILIGGLFVPVIGFGGYAAIPGLGALMGTILGCIALCTYVIELPFRIIVKFLSIACFFLSRGRFDPRTRIPDMQFLQRSAGTTSILPWWGEKKKADEEEIQPYIAASGEEIIVDKKTVSFICTGTRATDAISTFNEVAQEPAIRATRVLRTSGTLNLHGHTPTPIIVGTGDISPKAEIYHAALARGARDEALKAWLYKEMGQNYKEQHTGLKHEAGVLIINTDPHEIPPMAGMLRRIHEAFPLTVIWILLSVARHERNSEAMKKAASVISTLFQNHVVTTCTMIDAHSYTHADLLRHLAKTVMGLLVMKEQFPANPGLVEVLHMIASNGSPFTATRHSSEKIVSGQIPPQHAWQGIFKNKGAGEISDMVSSTKQAIDDMEEKPETGSIELPINHDLLSFILCMVPMPSTDKNKMMQYASLMTTFIRSKLARPLFVRTLGEPTNEQLTSGYIVGASWLYTILPDDVIQLPQISTPPTKALPEHAHSKEQQSQEPEQDELEDTSQGEVVEDEKVPTVLNQEDFTDVNAQPNGNAHKNGAVANGKKASRGRGRPPKQAKSEEEQ